MPRFEMRGSQPIVLTTGQTISPGADDFDAAIDAIEEDFLTRIGAIRRAPVPKFVAPAEQAEKE